MFTFFPSSKYTFLQNSADVERQMKETQAQRKKLELRESREKVSNLNYWAFLVTKLKIG